MRLLFIHDDDFGPLWFNLAFLWSVKRRERKIYFVTTDEKVSYTETFGDEASAGKRLADILMRLT